VSECVQYACETPDEKTDVHFRKQYVVVYKNGKKLVDYVAKTETLQADIQEIAKKTGCWPINTKCPHINVPRNIPARSLSMDELEKLEVHYKEDFKLFGYEPEFEIPKVTIRS